jgi:hypothetical protein
VTYRGGVVSSGGALPDSVAVFGNLVYVANSGSGDANYTGFRLGFNGRLFPIPGSTVSLAANAVPADVLFNGTGANLVGTEVGTSRLAARHVRDCTGQLVTRSRNCRPGVWAGRCGPRLSRLRAASGARPYARRGPCHPTRRAGRYPSAEATA